jgi:hypothetical protein
MIVRRDWGSWFYCKNSARAASPSSIFHLQTVVFFLVVSVFVKKKEEDKRDEEEREEERE